MNCISQSSSTASAESPISDTNKDIVRGDTPTLTLPPSGTRPSVGPDQAVYVGSAPPYAEHDPAVVKNSSETLPPPYAESEPRFIVGDSKDPLACDIVRDGDSVHTGALEDSSSLQVVACDPHVDDGTARRDVTILILRPVSIRCTTIGTPAARDLNFHVNGVLALRWRPTSNSIPIGIDSSTFESNGQASLVKRCLCRVLDSLNAKNACPRFHYVDEPSDSAFYISFGGDDPRRYASSFFPGSHPKDWYIYVYKLGLTLSRKQKRFLKETVGEGGDIKAARLRALEQNLTIILAHEMLHVIGIRHCDAHRTEKEVPCVRYPPGLPNKYTRDPLMKSKLGWEDFSRLAWKPRTIEEIRKIYSMEEGEKMGRYTIQDVSWEDGAGVRKIMALHKARCCVPKP
ncbi:hypothetical protein KVR01_003084 [Diaporthe batatas]|uniref:uncharacterized protein n=1 Tax=Diaporthe batatas TaxID=748121 RepID=UPI001D054BEB|nr:uncharacterized protein KVR01_003084 [Diaporthe batatas]KAG8167395.1 hypothetical protein KVR01_003084 [Diaporthe batatas]